MYGRTVYWDNWKYYQIFAFNIELLKIKEKPVFSEYFDMISA